MVSDNVKIYKKNILLCAMLRTPISLMKNVTGLQPNTGFNGFLTRPTHLKMLSCVFSYVPETWKTCPITTNVVERKNYECKTDTPQSLKLAMINVYKLGKNTCCKHIAAKNRCSISYRSRDEEAHKQNAESQRRQHAIAFNSNKAAQHGPLDHSTNFNCSKAVRKRKKN